MVGHMNTQPPNDIVTLDELSRRLKLSKAWLHREANAGRLPSLRAGKRRLFNPAAVSATLAARAADPDNTEGGAV